MQTFKEYLAEKNKRKESRRGMPSEETVFASHAKEKQSTKKPRKPSEETVFGHHSKKRLQESNHVNEIELSKDGHDHIHNVIAPPTHKLSEDEEDALQSYTDHSTPLNGALVHYHNGHSMNTKLKPDIDKLTTALLKHKTSDDTVVYSGVKQSPSRHFKTALNSVEVHHPAFISSSTSFGMAKGFSEPVRNKSGEESRHVLKITLPKHTSAMSVRNFSFVPGEHEILINRGHDLEIHSKPTIHVDDDGQKYHIWHTTVASHCPANLDGQDL